MDRTETDLRALLDNVIEQANTKAMERECSLKDIEIIRQTIDVLAVYEAIRKNK